MSSRGEYLRVVGILVMVEKIGHFRNMLIPLTKHHLRLESNILAACHAITQLANQTSLAQSLLLHDSSYDTGPNSSATTHSPLPVDTPRGHIHLKKQGTAGGIYSF